MEKSFIIVALRSPLYKKHILYLAYPCESQFLFHSLSLSRQMSQVFISSPKHCAKRGFHVNHLFKKIFCLFSGAFTLILSLILLVWLILRPTKPEFSLKEADVYQLNLSAPHLLDSSIQFTLLSKNPNQKVGIYYDELHVYAAYKGERITLATSVPPFYQGHQDRNMLSASLVGAGVPVSPSFGYEVGRAQTAGTLVLNLKVDGRLRWKVGTWVSGRYRFDVDCAVALPFGPAFPTGPLSSKQGTQCSTAV